MKFLMGKAVERRKSMVERGKKRRKWGPGEGRVDNVIYFLID